MFVLHDVEGYRHEEIAEMLGLATGTSKSQLHRARLALPPAPRPIEGSKHMSDQWMERLSEYLDDELAEGERVALEAHLESCTDCSVVLADLRAVVERARRLDAYLPRQRPLAGDRRPYRRNASRPLPDRAGGASRSPAGRCCAFS